MKPIARLAAATLLALSTLPAFSQPIPHPYLHHSGRPIPPRRQTLQSPLRRTPLRPHPPRILARPPKNGPSHGPQHHRHLRLLERPRTLPRPVQLLRQRRPRRLHQGRPGRRPLRHPPRRSLLLRRVGVRRLPRMAPQRPPHVHRPPHQRPRLHGPRRALDQPPRPGNRLTPDRSRRPHPHHPG